MLSSIPPGAHGDPYTHYYERPPLPDNAHWGHAPSHHAGEYVYPGRAVLMLPGRPWAESPERCTNADPLANDWYGYDGEATILVCRRCGLDVT
ncbi:hypothetical protein FHR84_000475 [Actinopolyspora biskrensis]|uniref:Uncharacterized protein n=1 Tax=Actinopolyspora biskrensis TaxID=1470178 RepID=A0A852YQZ8_9ACTN|nr:hypothetical protein [Actinopolyspora biskrensis]NYH77161.1 hypothetical protein [Actinopolyspora biskrensis]